MKKFLMVSVLCALIFAPNIGQASDDDDLLGLEEEEETETPAENTETNMDTPEKEKTVVPENTEKTSEKKDKESSENAENDDILDFGDTAEQEETEQNAKEQEKNINPEKNAEATTNADAPDYFDDYIQSEENKDKSQVEARKILSGKRQKLDLRQNEKKSIEQGLQARDQMKDKFKKKDEDALKPQEKLQELKKEFVKAPLGLYWDASQEQMKKMGFKLSRAEREGYENTFLVESSAKNNSKFAKVFAIFGQKDKLWCIYATGDLLEDDAKASKVLQLYDKYYNTLSQKYGNAEEFFTPYKYTEEVKSKDERGKEIVTTEARENPRGGENFLQELQEGKAVLYAAFHNNKVGVTLSVNVDKYGKSYIAIDYKYFATMDQEKEAEDEDL